MERATSGPRSEVMKCRPCPCVCNGASHDNRLASGAAPSGQGEWSGCAGRVFSSLDRVCGSCRTAFGDVAVAVAFEPPVECTQGEDVPVAGADRLGKRWRSNRALFERQPKSICSQQTKLEAAVERQVDANQRSAPRKFIQPEPVFRSSERHNGIPAIGGLPNLAASQFSEIKPVSIGRSRADRRADSQHGRQRLRRPENSLFVERLSRISCETSVPTFVGSDLQIRIVRV